jgi:hypothetical protein
MSIIGNGGRRIRCAALVFCLDFDLPQDIFGIYALLLCGKVLLKNLKQMKALLLMIVAVFAAAQVFGQVSTGGGQMSANGKGIFMDGRAISYAEAKGYLEPYPEAAKYLRAGQGYTIASYPVAFAGGYMLGYGLGSALNKNAKISKGTSVGLIAGGVAVIGGALGLTYIGIGKYKKAAQSYNESVGAFEPSDYRSASLAMTGTGGGLGLQLTF